MSVQEQVSDKIIALIINTGKSGVRYSGRLTAQMLAKAIKKMQEASRTQKSAVSQGQTAKAEVGMVPIKTLTAKGDTVNSFNLQAAKDEGKAKRSASKDAPGGGAKSEGTAESTSGNSVKNKGKAAIDRVNPKDKSLKSFDHIARKYGVSYSVTRDAANPSQFTVFFKAKAMSLEAFTKTHSKTSILKPLKESAAKIAQTHTASSPETAHKKKATLR